MPCVPVSQEFLKGPTPAVLLLLLSQGWGCWSPMPGLGLGIFAKRDLHRTPEHHPEQGAGGWEGKLSLLVLPFPS